MEAMYGARAEGHCRHEITECMVADFKSQYPTICTLLGLVELMLAERIDVVVNDPKDRAYLRNTTIEGVLSPDETHRRNTWRGMLTYVRILPRMDILPGRFIFTDIDDDTPTETQDDGEDNRYSQAAINIGVNYIHSGFETWYTAMDVLGSKFLTGKCPEVLETRRLIPVGRQADIKAIKFFGDDRYIIDLSNPGEDLFKRVIEMRSEIKWQLKSEEMSEEDRTRLDAMQLALKLLANATSYGVTIEFIVDERNKLNWTTVYHGTTKTRKPARSTVITENGERTKSGYKVERPGKYFAPYDPFIPAAGRLLIVMAEVLAKRVGLNYGMCDTDSFAFLRPKGMSRKDFQDNVKSIAGKRGLFQNLNPYTPNPGGEVDPILAIEEVNCAFKLIETIDKDGKLNGGIKIKEVTDKGGNSVLKPLYIFCISAKRYALCNIVKASDGSEYADIEELRADARNTHVVLRKATGHGLGHATAPGYISFQREHEAVSWSEHKSAAQPSEPKYGDVCKGRGNPRLFLDLWRMAIKNFIPVTNIQDAQIVSDFMDDTMRSLTGLSLIQKQQRTLGTRAAVEQYINMRDTAPFSLMEILPPPMRLYLPYENMPSEEREKMEQLHKTSFYAGYGVDINPRDKITDTTPIWRRDNNEVPLGLNEGYLSLEPVHLSLQGYFDHLEMKAKGHFGILDRHVIAVLDHEYIGKETNFLLDDDVAENDESQIEDAASIPILRRDTNPLVRKYILGNSAEIAEKAGVTVSEVMNAFNGSRSVVNTVMKYIRKSFFLENDKVISFMPDKRVISPLETKANELRDLLRKAYGKVRDDCIKHNNKLLERKDEIIKEEGMEAYVNQRLYPQAVFIASVEPPVELAEVKVCEHNLKIMDLFYDDNAEHFIRRVKAPIVEAFKDRLATVYGVARVKEQRAEYRLIKAERRRDPVYREQERLKQAERRKSPAAKAKDAERKRLVKLREWEEIDDAVHHACIIVQKSENHT